MQAADMPYKWSELPTYTAGHDYVNRMDGIDAVEY